MWRETRKTLFAYSPGGHFAELNRAIAGIHFDHAEHVTFKSERLPDHGCPTHFVMHPRRQIGRTLINTAQSAMILCKTRPKLVITTGADVAVPIFILARLIGAETIFVETGGSLAPTLAGRLCYPFAKLFIVQWPERLKTFPKARLAAGLLL